MAEGPNSILWPTNGGIRYRRNSVIWDYVAIYRSGETWAEAPPKPLYEGSPVVRSIAGADRALRRLSQ